MVRRENCVRVEHLRGGRGHVFVCHVLPKEELRGHGSMYARVVLPPGSSVGWHTHEHDTEPYYILRGEADFIDNDGSVTRVTAGDVCTILPGQSHSIENNSDSEVQLMALIYNE